MSETSPEAIYQGLATYAFKKVKGVFEEKGQKVGDDYKAFARKFPSILKTSGLGAALVFASHKHPTYYEHIKEWLCIQNNHVDIGKGEAQKDLRDVLLTFDTKRYLSLTFIVLDLCVWLKQDAEAISKNTAG